MWSSNPWPFTLLTQCSTTEPQEHNIKWVKNNNNKLSYVASLINPSTNPKELPAETHCLDSYKLAADPGLSSMPERLRFQQCKAYAYENNDLTLSSGASWLQIEGPDAVPGNVCNYNLHQNSLHAHNAVEKPHKSLSSIGMPVPRGPLSLLVIY